MPRMENSQAPKEEGLRIILEIIGKLKGMTSVNGIHMMAVACEDIVQDIIDKSGPMPRPVV